MKSMIDTKGNITENFKDIDGIEFKYKGKKTNGKREGYGTLFSADGLIAYQGNFHNDKYEGEGREYNPCPGAMRKGLNYRNLVFYDAYWVKYEGTFKNGKKHGKGKMVQTNAEIFESTWENGKVNGEGFIYKTNGKVYKGIWVDDGYIDKEGFGNMKPATDVTTEDAVALISKGQ